MLQVTSVTSVTSDQCDQASLWPCSPLLASGHPALSTHLTVRPQLRLKLSSLHTNTFISARSLYQLYVLHSLHFSLQATFYWHTVSECVFCILFDPIFIKVAPVPVPVLVPVLVLVPSPKSADISYSMSRN